MALKGGKPGGGERNKDLLHGSCTFEIVFRFFFFLLTKIRDFPIKWGTASKPRKVGENCWDAPNFKYVAKTGMFGWGKIGWVGGGRTEELSICHKKKKKGADPATPLFVTRTPLFHARTPPQAILTPPLRILIFYSPQAYIFAPVPPSSTCNTCPPNLINYDGVISTLLTRPGSICYQTLFSPPLGGYTRSSD